jgi:hypothetical protein
MKQTYVILRTIARSRAPQPGGPTAGPAGETSGVAVDVDSLDSAELARVTRDRSVLAVAPAIPMKLIEPLQAPGVQPLAAGVDWGCELSKGEGLSRDRERALC